MKKVLRFVPLTCFGLIFVAPVALAWGPLGHRVVAQLAWDQLTPSARAEVTKLLHSQSPYITLVSIANWPDRLQAYPSKKKLWDHTHRMHYVDIFNKHCRYEPQLVCRQGQCVVAAIKHYEAVLGNRKLSSSTRLQALKFVVHFIGDEHEPLHAYGPGAGENEYKVTFFGRQTELHRVWDSGMLLTREMTWLPYAKFLESEGAVSLPVPVPGENSAVQVAEASCRIAQMAVPKGHTLGRAYVKKWLPVADHQLRLGGARLARVLNRLLG